MKTIVAFIVGLLISTAAWAQVDHANGIVWLPAHHGHLKWIRLSPCALSNGPAQRWRRGVEYGDHIFTEKV